MKWQRNEFPPFSLKTGDFLPRDTFPLKTCFGSKQPPHWAFTHAEAPLSSPCARDWLHVVTKKYRNFPNIVRPRNYYAPRLWSRNVQKSSKPPDNTHPLLIKFSRELSMVCDATVTQTRGSHLVNWSFNVCWPRRHDQLSVITGFSPRNLRDLKVMFYERSSISQRIEFFKRLEIHTVKKLVCSVPEITAHPKLWMKFQRKKSVLYTGNYGRFFME